MAHTSDLVIVGSGIAGLSLAIQVAQRRKDLKITVLAKTTEKESNTNFAQGGIATVWDVEVDNFEKHIADTLDAGDGLCDKEVVEIVVKSAPERVRELIDWGANFDKTQTGEYDLGREGGHTENRILHYKDITGREIQRTVVEKAAQYDNIEILEHYFAIDIITQHHLGYNVSRLTPNIECYGVYALDRKTNEIKTFLAKQTILASGGAGQVYQTTTNPLVATGDGMAMFYRAKGRISNMEFVQFHPTALYNPGGDKPDFLISEAVRGYGAILKDAQGREFMQKYDERLSLAPRDIVARAIDNEMKIQGADKMFLDCRHLDREGFLRHFPNIYEKCKSIGIDPFVQMIPIVPACHYMCGGIKIDHEGRSSINRLYAAGECTNSGLHGANRLASNSLLEGLVFGYRAAMDILATIDNYDICKGIPEWNARGTSDPKEMVLITQSRKEVNEIMSNYVGIVRSNVRLKRADDRMYLLYKETEELYNTTTISPQLCELRNLITISYLIIKSATMRHESRGLHYTTDYPDKLPFLQDTLM